MPPALVYLGVGFDCGCGVGSGSTSLASESDEASSGMAFPGLYLGALTGFAVMRLEDIVSYECYEPKSYGLHFLGVQLLMPPG